MSLMVEQPLYQPAVSLSYEHALSLFDHADVIALDTETNGEDVRDGSGVLYGISICARSASGNLFTHYFSVRHPSYGPYHSDNLGADDFFKLKQKIENYKGFLVFHNAKFDLESLRTVGINYTGKYYCTLLLAHLLNEIFPMDKSLDNCGKYYLKDSGKKQSPEFNTFKALFGWANMPTDIIREYAEYDANLTLRLWEFLWKKLSLEEREYWLTHKMPYVRVIIAMERRGVRMDVEKCERMTALGHSQMDDIAEILGVVPAGKALEDLLLNKLQLPVVKRSKKTNKPSFDKEAMEYYDMLLENRSDETARLILAYRGWQKAVSSCYIPYVTRLSLDGRLRCNYKLHGTKTGRMSCYDPNLQQIPRSGDKPWNGDMKSCFVARDGWELWEFDYAQLELRLGTAYADEHTLKAVFEEGRDIFTEMSGPMGLERQQTKTFVYSTQYGAGIKRLVEVFGWTRDHAAEVRNRYFTAYPGFAQKSKAAGIRARVNGKVKLWSGRSRHFYDPEKEAHKAFNSVIQGGAADIVERTMMRLFDQVDRDDECRMLLQVHDSVVFEIRSDLVEKYTALITDVMTNVEPDFGVKFAVEGKKFGAK